jgi:hypothetical protein
VADTSKDLGQIVEVADTSKDLGQIVEVADTSKDLVAVPSMDMEDMPIAGMVHRKKVGPALA